MISFSFLFNYYFKNIDYSLFYTFLRLRNGSIFLTYLFSNIFYYSITFSIFCYFLFYDGLDYLLYEESIIYYFELNYLLLSIYLFCYFEVILMLFYFNFLFGEGAVIWGFLAYYFSVLKLSYSYEIFFNYLFSWLLESFYGFIF